MDSILSIERVYNFRSIEDSGHAFSTRQRGRMIGSMGDLTAFSFYATKTLSTGEGGMLTTANAEYAERASMQSLHGISRDAWHLYMLRLQLDRLTITRDAFIQELARANIGTSVHF